MRSLRSSVSIEVVLPGSSGPAAAANCGHRGRPGRRCHANSSRARGRAGLCCWVPHVAYKCRHICDDLGQPTSMGPASASVQSRWLQTISRWMTVVEDFEDLKLHGMMGPTTDQSPDILKRLVACVTATGLGQRIARKLVSTKLHLCLRWLHGARASSQQSARRQEK